MAKAEVSSTAVTAGVVILGGALLYSLYLANQGLKEINRDLEWWAGGLEQAKTDITDIPSDILGGIGGTLRKPFTYIQDKPLAIMEGGKELLPDKKEGNRWGFGYGPKKGFTKWRTYL